MINIKVSIFDLPKFYPNELDSEKQAGKIFDFALNDLDKVFILEDFINGKDCKEFFCNYDELFPLAIALIKEHIKIYEHITLSEIYQLLDIQRLRDFDKILIRYNCAYPDEEIDLDARDCLSDDDDYTEIEVVDLNYDDKNGLVVVFDCDIVNSILEELQYRGKVSYKRK